MSPLLYSFWLARTRLAPRERWDARQLEQFQSKALRRLLLHASAHSSFYRELYHGLDLGRVPLSEVPTVNKKMLMANFDAAVTDPELRFEGLQRFLETAGKRKLYLDRYVVKPTSGSTGVPGIFVYSAEAHATLFAAVQRLIAMNGVRLTLPWKLVILAGAATTRGTNRMMGGAKNWIFQTHTLSGDTPLPDLVGALNGIQPHGIIGYPSLLLQLAREQSKGHLRISPRALGGGGEVRPPTLADEVEGAWPGVPLVEHYALTEVGFAGGSCRKCRAMHLFDDLAIFEMLDDEGRPIRPGETGRRMLVTNLYNLTLPIIRYEVSDMVTLAHGGNPCGRPWTKVLSVGGRAEELLQLSAFDGRPVSVDPATFRETLGRMAGVAEYQLTLVNDSLEVLIVPPAEARKDGLADEVVQLIRAALTGQGVEPPPIRVLVVASLPRTGGKLKPIGTAGARAAEA
jgi:phenylacetate-coenzyme A ligase PaaK-like adenylate-forming protein